MGRILVSVTRFDTLCREAWELLEQNGHEVVYQRRPFPAYSYEELKEILPEIDGAIIGLDKYDADVFAISDRLKVVTKFGVGMDNVDLKAAAARRVYCANTPGCNTNAVAELTAALMIDLLRGVVEIHGELAQGAWPRPVGGEIRGRTVGLLGFGAIGKLVARKLLGWDVTVQAYDPYMDAAAAETLRVKVCSSAEEVISSSDLLSLHIPATAENYHMFDAAMLTSMKKGSYLVNCARGALVDLDALCAALKSGHIAGAAIDAFEQEPLPKDAEIFSCGNVVCLPHIGAETAEAYRAVSLCAAKAVIDALDGREPEFWVNKW